MHRSTVRRYLAKMSVPIRPRSRIMKPDEAATRDQEIINLYAAGLSQNKIAEQLGIGQSSVSRLLRARGVPMQVRSYDPGIRAANLKKFNEAVRARHEQRDGVIGKLCRKCQNWRPLDEFGRSKVTLDALENRCRDCNRARTREQARRDSEKIAKIRRTAEFRDRHRAYYREWERKRRKSDLNYRITKVLRLRVWRALKGIRKERPTLELLGCSLDDLRRHLESQFVEGMTWDNYGRGGWEVDHIRPCSSFDLSDPKQQRECFHYSNMQPLWGIDNWRKGSRY